MLSDKKIRKIEEAKSNILRGNDIESAALILERCVLDNCIIASGRVNILKVATRQILTFIENAKNKGVLDYARENVSLKMEIKELKKKNQNLKIKQNGCLSKEKKYCFNEDGNTGKCLGYSFFNDDEPCEYCKGCESINISEED